MIRRTVKAYWKCSQPKPVSGTDRGLIIFASGMMALGVILWEFLL